MVKLTIVGRVRDGLPLAQGPRYVHQEDERKLFYKQQAELILKEISRGALPLSKMSIRIDHHCFIYVVENGICYITLCESSYPRKLAFQYLQDLQSEIEMIDNFKELAENITRHYSFIKIDYVIGNLRKQYTDTRSQVNISRLNAQPRHSKEDIAEGDLSTIIENRRKTDILERALLKTHPVSSIWCSQLLKTIALKWTPLTILIVVASVVLWANFISTVPEAFATP